MDIVLWIAAIICFLIGAGGSYLGRPAMIAIGWLGFIAAALTFIL